MTAGPAVGGGRATAARSRRRWHLAGHLLVAAWLLAGLGVALAHPFVPRAGWLLVHLLVLGAAGTAVLVWSEHFALTLLHRPETGRAVGRAGRLGGFTLGAAGACAGMVAGFWPAVLAGGLLVGAVALVHAGSLARLARGALPGRFAFVLRYYLTAACLLPVGAGLGVVLARDSLDDDTQARLRLAHEALNGLGFLGLTVLGTLVTLWPTMLRTRIAEGAEAAARQALPWLQAGVALSAGLALVAPPPACLAGVACYAVGLVTLLRPLFTAARSRPPSAAPAWSVLAGQGWLLVTLAGLALVLATGRRWADVDGALDPLTPLLAAGWIAQTLLGALGYLVPVLIGGGPSVVRRTVAVLDRWGAARVTALNLGLVVAAAPVPSAVRVGCAGAVLLALLAHVALLVRAAVLGRALRRPDAQPETPTSQPARLHRTAGGAAGLAVVVLAVAAGAAVDPTALAGGHAATVAVTPTGHTTTATVRITGMRFVPDRIDVPAGDRLVLVVPNTDGDRHDLRLSGGARTARIAPGATATLDAGVVGADLQGWCTVVGHRQSGMRLTVHAVGRASPATAGADGMAGMQGTDGTDGTATGPDATLDPMAQPAPGSAAREARLDPLPASTAPRTVRRTLTVREVVREVAPGVRQRVWTFDGTVPGPVLHGRVGDTFEITLVNDGSIGHSIDFHASQVDPAPVMRTIQPGRSLVYRFTAARSGIWMYHCSTMPISLHIANGLFGAVVVDPPDADAVADEYVLVQSEDYLGPQGSTADVAKLRAARPDAVVFNGYPYQYVARPLTATAGRRVRIWVLDAGPSLPTSFHVVGARFDTEYVEGAYRLRPGDPAVGAAQVLDLGPAGGGFVELSFPGPGTYPFVTHRMIDAERGARGAISVTP